MKQLTVRGVDDVLYQLLKQQAEQTGQSMNQHVLTLLRRGMGMEQRPLPPTRHHDLDHLAGTWSEEAYAEFEQSLSAQRQIDVEMWA